jgi:hypothetical protein
MRPSKRAANWCQVELPTRVESTHPLIVGPDIRCWQRVNVRKSTCSRLTDVVTRMLVKADEATFALQSNGRLLGGAAV